VSILANIAVGLALGFLKWWVSREDIKKGERQRLLIEKLELENAALEWLAEARRDPARWSKLRVLPGAASFESFHLVVKDEPDGRSLRSRRAGGVVRGDPDG